MNTKHFTIKHYCLLLLLFILSVTGSYQLYGQEKIAKLYPTDSIVSRYHNDWTQFHYRQRIKQFKKEPLQFNEIVFIGNSITEKGRDWNEKFGIQPIRNRGISGDVTDGVLKRIDEIVYFKPKAVFILIGINDLFSIHHDVDNRHNLKYDKIVPSTTYIAKNILLITKRIHRETPDTRIFVRTLLPTRRDYLKDDIIIVNNTLKKNAKKGLYTLIDLYAEFVDDDGMMHKEFTVDGVHLSEEGYACWVEFEKPVISELVQIQGN